MMKNKNGFTFIALLSMLLMGCTVANKDADAFVIERSYQNQEKNVIDVSTLEAKMLNLDSFVLEIYSESCTTCLEFEPIINTYIEDNQAVIYGIETGQDFMPSNSLIPWSVTPTLVIVKEGVVWQKVNATNNSTVFASLSNLSNYLNQYTILGPAINVTDDQLDLLIANDETFIVYYKRDTCSDCTFFASHYLDSFNKDEDNASKFYYVFDINEYYLNRTSSSDPYWLTFTAKYNLSDPDVNSYGGSAEYGYKTGVVPTFQYYLNGTIADAVVIYNDNFSVVRDDNNVVTSITVTSSYFGDAPFINTTYNATQDTSASNVYKTATLSYYGQKVEELFDIIYSE